MASPTDPNAQFNAVATKIRQLSSVVTQMAAERQTLMDLVKGSRSITQEIDSIPGRRIFYTFVANIPFDISDDGLRGNPLTFLISQDGPFIQTHYPSVSWKPTLPTNATNFGEWSPVGSWPLPTQQGGANQDRIDISYEYVDGGSQRNFQNAAVGQVLSRPDNLIPLPVPTLFSPNATIQFFPTYENILFAAGAAVPTTQGELVVSLPGYRIANL